MNINNGDRFHDLKKNLRIIIGELEKMQSDPENQVEHYTEAYHLARLAYAELKQIVPGVKNSRKTEFEFESGILIDDHRLYADRWNHEGLNFGKSVIYYASKEEFLAEQFKYDKGIFLYIDWYLCSLGTSYEFIQQLSADYGFKNIIITTEAADLDSFDVPWAKAIIRKDPPWQYGSTDN